MGAPLSSPTLADPLSLSPICCSRPLPLPLLPLGSSPLPSPRLPPPSRSPPTQDREEEEHVELKRERGSRRCSSPSLLEDFLGENPRCLHSGSCLVHFSSSMKASECSGGCYRFDLLFHRLHSNSESSNSFIIELYGDALLDCIILMLNHILTMMMIRV
jgi:hypothetical protein